MKPETCKSCLMFDKGQGFVPDFTVKDPVLIIVGEAPGKTEVDESVPFCGRVGAWLRQNLLEPAGIDPNRVCYTNTIRCLWPNSSNPYPTGKIRKNAESCCRQYDVLARFPGVPVMLMGSKAINLHYGVENVAKMHGHIEFREGRMWGCTYHPAAILRKPPLLPLILREIKNLMLAVEHPEVLALPEVIKHVLPHKKEGVFDLEWNIATKKITIMGFADSPKKAYSAYAMESEINDFVKEIRSGSRIIGHNIIDADLPILGFSFEEILDLVDKDCIFDTFISAHRNHPHWAADESAKQGIPLGLYDLESMRKYYGPCGNWKHLRIGDGLIYNGYDNAHNRFIYEYEDNLLGAFGLRHIFKRDMKLAAICGEMHRRGIKLDTAALEKYGDEVEERRKEIKVQLEEKGPKDKKGKKFNPNSPVQIKAFAKATLGINLSNTEFDTLKRYEGRNADFDLLIEYREDVKQLKTWFPVEVTSGRVIATDEYIYPKFKVTGTDMGRLSSSGPNFQNITAEGLKVYGGGIVKRKPNLRRFIIPREKGMALWSFDYKQVEDWTFGFCAGDKILLENLKTKDIHSITGASYFSKLEGRLIDWTEVTKDQRNVGKITNHKAKYGILAATLAFDMFGNRTAESKRVAERLLEEYFGLYRRVREYQQEVFRQARSGVLVTPFGSRLKIYAMEDHDYLKKGCHFMGSGTAADAFNDRAVEVWETVKKLPILLVHDEQVFELPPDDLQTARQIKEVLEAPFAELGGISLPVEVKMGFDYGHLKPVVL